MTHGFRERVAAEVRAEIGRQGVTASSVSERADISRSALSRKLCGAADFTLEELVRVADVLNVPASALVARAEAAEVAA